MPKIIIDTDSPEYEQRMKIAKARAEWEFGSTGWAPILINAFLYPEEEARALEAEVNAT